MVMKRFFTLEKGAEESFSRLIEKLESLEFQKKDYVEHHGDYAQRGGIIDVYPFAGENPVRLEFFGDFLESIREFDALSQRSIRELAAATIVADFLPGADTEQPSSSEQTTIFDYAGEDVFVVLDDPEVLEELSQPPPAEERSATISREVIIHRLADLPQMHLRPGGSSADVEVDFRSTPQPAFNGSVKLLREALTKLLGQGNKVIISCDSPSEQQRLKELLTSIGRDRHESDPMEMDAGADDLERVEFSRETLHEGFVIPEARLVFFTEHQIFNRLKRRGRRRKQRFRGFTDRDVHQLRRGDFVVHRDYGIGRFERLKKIRVNNVEQEVVKVRYEGDDTLYVNLNYINRLKKYSSKEGHVPKLSRLGSPDWNRLRSRAKKRVKDIARELIALYAKRKKSRGFVFPEDAMWQREMEASFMYEDTFDQAKATREVKQDMEEAFPMDRLICGDVGFGKTEVAVRAAFKAVLGGKQAAILVPTTILAMQHQKTFVDRISRYGVNIQVLSRFKTRKAQMSILEGLRGGTVDIVIGTHRLLSRDVSFKDLGLLIIDEEHRFGVAAKEKLRQLRNDVDTLALTATPIPRTLHFSLMGARDLSIIGTPPRNRLPILTELRRWDDELIREAVMREVGRGGQIYFVHDRVQNIQEITERVQGLVPGVRIGCAHGQMSARELEEVMMEFLERKVDLLVATKIIESGLDIPNVNTIVVNRADRFGMAELYQLRGRVGRSNVQAYAYLLAPPASVMPKSTVQRLRALQEFTELGSGLNLAMRDLEIRGAGNLLGSEQSGFIESMGFETYTKILEEAVQEVKEGEFQDLFRGEGPGPRRLEGTVVDVDFDAYIPESYVENDNERLTLYRQLYDLTSSVQLAEVMEEMKDRFGKHPPEAENLFGAIAIRIEAAKIGFSKVRIAGEGMELEFPPEGDSAFYDGEVFQQIMSAIPKLKSRGARLQKEGESLRLKVTRAVSTGSPPATREVLELLGSLAGG
jgi:transcription-repair coupling factor (superfamily II helicase)